MSFKKMNYFIENVIVKIPLDDNSITTINSFGLLSYH